MTNVADRQRAYEATRLRRLGEIADRMAGDTWQVVADDRGMFVTSERFEGDRVAVCKFGRTVVDDEIALVSEALETLLFLLMMIRRASEKVRDLDRRVAELAAENDALKAGPPAEGKDYAAQVSMLLVDARFQQFLGELRDGEVVDDKETADAAVKALLGIKSKTELNAARRWLDLRARYSAWQTGAMG